LYRDAKNGHNHYQKKGKRSMLSLMIKIQLSNYQVQIVDMKYGINSVKTMRGIISVLIISIIAFEDSSTVPSNEIEKEGG
jgi:hypothetical protein